MTYPELAKQIGELVEEKQKSYGNSFGRAGQVLKVLYPEGVKPEQYDDMLAVVRIVDKLFRIANQRDAFGESPGRDIAGYGLLMAARHERKPVDIGTAMLRGCRAAEKRKKHADSE